MGARSATKDNKWNSKKLYRREEVVRIIRSCLCKYRASICASLTVELALILPILLISIAALCYRIEIDTIDRAVEVALLETGKVMAKDAVINNEYSLIKGKAHLYKSVKERGVRTDFIMGGEAGIMLLHSHIDKETGIMDLFATYYVRIPGIRDFPIRREKSIKAKSWCGYVSEDEINKEKEMVYITKNGEVYHRSRDCKHINRTVSSVYESDLKSIRNKNGSKYKPCHCAYNAIGGCYFVTPYGTNYHGDVNCSAINIVVYKVPLSEVEGRRPCKNCGGN